MFQYTVGNTKILALALSFSFINCGTFAENEKIQPLVVMPLEKSPLAANGHAMPMKGKPVIRSAFDAGYSCVFELMVYLSDSPEARINILGNDLLAKFDEFINLRNSLLILTVFPGRCIKISPFLY